MKNIKQIKIGWLIGILLILQFGCGGATVNDLPTNHDSSHKESTKGITITGSVAEEATPADQTLLAAYAESQSEAFTDASSEAVSDAGSVLCKKYDGTVLATGRTDDSGIILDVAVSEDTLDSTRQVICQAVNHQGLKLLGHYDLTGFADGEAVIGNIDLSTTRAALQILSQCGEKASFDSLDSCAVKITAGLIEPTKLYEEYQTNEEVQASAKPAPDPETNPEDPADDSDNPVSVEVSTVSAITEAVPTEVGSFMMPKLNRHGLVAYYPFNGNAKDASGRGNDGTVHGAVLTGDRGGLNNRAYHFNGDESGKSDYIEVPSSPSLDIRHAITMAAWVRHDAVFHPTPHFIIYKIPQSWPYYNLGGYTLSAWWANPNGYAAELYDGAHENNCDSQHIIYAYNGLAGDFTKNPLMNTWTHVASTWDGKTFTIYRNGVKQNSNDFVGSIGPSDGSLIIGTRPGKYPSPLDETIDEVVIYNRALSDTEIVDLMHGKMAPFVVTINIRPWNPANPIYLRGMGQVPVAILSTASFAAPTLVDQNSLTFGSTGDEDSLNSCETRDVNRDGFADLVCYFDNQMAAFGPADTQGTLKGATVDGIGIEGTDDIMIVE